MSVERKSGFLPEAKIGTFNGEPILPPSSPDKKLTVEDLRTTYPLRYKAYARAQGLEVNGKENGIPSDVLTRRLRMLNNLDRYITSHEKSEEGRVLREKQMSVFKDIRDSLEKGITEGFVEAPTGFGKTVLFSQIIKATDQKTVVAVPTKVLVEQTYEQLKKFNPDLDVGRVYGDRNRKETGKKVTVTTYKSLSSSNNGINPKDTDLLILDEAHQSLTGPRIDAAGKFNSVKLGFTATPEFTEDKRVDKLLNNQIHKITLKEAVETGLLSSFSVYLAETDVDLSNVSIASNGDYDKKELDKAINIQSRNKSAVELYQKLVEKNPDLAKCIINCISINHARKVANLFQEAGIGADAVYGAIDQKERDDIVKRYKEGQLNVLTNVNILTEGFDVPQASLAINLRPTLSVVIAKQRGGRALRLDQENPAKHAVIVDYLDKNEKKRNLQITFAQVAQGVRIINPTEGDIREKKEKNEQEKEPKQPIIIDGLSVITNTQEVLRVVKGIETQMEKNPYVTETDFVISASSLRSTFIGEFQNLKTIAYEVINNLKKEHSDIIQEKINRSQHVTVVTNTDIFIQEMLNKGAILKQPLENIREGDFLITYRNIIKMFESKAEKNFHIVEEILEQLRVSNPDIFAIRKNPEKKSRIYTQVITDPKPLIEAMLEKGITLKIPKSQTINLNEITNTRKQLLKTFILKKDLVEIKAAANQVIEEIKRENPELVGQKKSGTATVTVVTDKDLFIEKMRKKGFMSRKDSSIQELQPTDFSINREDLANFFIGNTDKVTKAARNITCALKEEKPELIVKRLTKRIGNREIYINAITDRELFIKLMQKEGFTPRNDGSLQEVQHTDFSINNPYLKKYFIGHMNNIAKTAREIVDKLSNERPELVAKRQNKKGRPPQCVVTDRELFIKLMEERGFKKRQNTSGDIFP